MKKYPLVTKLLAVLFALLVTSLLGFIAGDIFYSRYHIYPNVYVERVLVGGMTPERAREVLNRYSTDDLLIRPYALTYGKKNIYLLPSQIGVTGDIDRAVVNAYQISKRQNYFMLLWARLLRRPVIVRVPLLLTYPGYLDRFLAAVAERVDRGPHSAGFVRGKTTRKYVIQKEVPGLKVNIAATKGILLSNISEGEREIPMDITELEPKLKADVLQGIPHPDLLGYYTTYYGTHDSPNRIHNIMLITHEQINDTVLHPGQTFSLAQTIGNFTKERGFKEAFVIVGDELVPELGGGACQTATTLYNAVQLADLKVLQRVNHALYFSIYPLGRDAAIYPPYPNLKFTNDTGYPVIIKGYATKYSLTYWIWGEHSGKSVYFTAPALYYLKKTKQVAETIDKLKTAPKNKTVQNPFRTYVQRIVKQNGKIIKKEDIWSTYLANGDRDRIRIRRLEPR